MSYKGETEISLAASREQQHGSTLAVIRRLKLRLMPLAMLFGGNASGKSNFFKSLSFCKAFVTFGMQMQPDEPIGVEPFLLDESGPAKPSWFKFSILTGNDVYDYSFAATRKRVTAERLVRRTSPAKDLSYSREWDESAGKYSFTFGKAFEPELQLAELIARTTRENQLFLSLAAAQNLLQLLPAYNWFSRTLQLVSPIAHYAPIERYADKSWPTSRRVNEMLREFDTGVSEIKRTRVQRSEIPIDQRFLDNLILQTREGMTLRICRNDETMPYLVSRRNGEPIFEKLTTCHQTKCGGGSCAEFELSHESEGTQRILDLLPVFAELENDAEPKTFVIDEIDRQLHTMATRRLIELFLETRKSSSRSQILATTHDLFLMDQKYLRRDEMWLAERNPRTEVSKLTCVNSFKETRKSQDLLSHYLSGKLGGIPAILGLRTAETDNGEAESETPPAAF